MDKPESLSPMMQQYQAAREAHPGALVLFRVGDFFELFGEDAVTASKVLGITLTSRDKTLPMAGFPHVAIEGHLRKLIQNGFRVAVCDQVEEASVAKGLVRREVVRVVTPGTLTEDTLLDPRKANHLVALCLNEEEAGLAWVDLTAGTFFACNVNSVRLPEELARLDPAECLFPENLPGAWLDPMKIACETSTWTKRPTWQFQHDTARKQLLEQFHLATLEGFGFKDDDACLSAAGALLAYLKETVKSSVAHLRKLAPYRSTEVLGLDAVTRKALEMVRTNRDGRREGSLLDSIDRTITPMGARLLHDRLLAPVTNDMIIAHRLQAVGVLKKQKGVRQRLRELFKAVPDFPRLITRVCTGRASPRDLVAIGNGLAQIPGFQQTLAAVDAASSTLLSHLFQSLHPCPALAQLLFTALLEQPQVNPKDGNIFQAGYHARLDELRDLARGGKDWITKYQASEVERTGIPSLKVGFTSVFGYYIEITHTHTSKVPSDYQRKQTLKNAERYITPELKQYEEQVLKAEEESKNLEYELFVQLREKVAIDAGLILDTADALAELDVLCSLAELADQEDWHPPEIVEEPILEAKQSRHPVLDQTLPKGTFVPNDVMLSGNSHFWLITGPNMAGKSTYIRQVALLQILAQMGSFLPVKKCKLGIADRIFARVGAGDDLTKGQSTFMVEMAETANILNNATARSLVILDEVGRGTSTYDGLALAWAIVEYMQSMIGCRTLFATHYHEITKLEEILPGVKNYHAAVHDEAGKITFLYRIAPGPADRSYGIHVAQLAGVPPAVLQRAMQVLDQLENQPLSLPAQAFETIRKRKRVTTLPGPSLFDHVS